jgi:hypothetical protein
MSAMSVRLELASWIYTLLILVSHAPVTSSYATCIVGAEVILVGHSIRGFT